VERAVLPVVAVAARRKSMFQRGSSFARMVVPMRREFVLWRRMVFWLLLEVVVVCLYSRGYLGCRLRAVALSVALY
jgi:hypothetical protein